MNALLLLAALSLAQEPGVAPPKPAEQPPTAPAGAFEVPDAATRLRNSVGLGFFGTGQTAALPSIGLGGLNGLSSTLSVPYLGLRWWTPLAFGPVRRVGLEIAAGVFFLDGTTELAVGSAVTTVNTTWRAFGVHAAVPLAIASTSNVLVHLAPELRWTTLEAANPSSTPLMGTPETRTPGANSTDLALRGGAELLFGFLGVPNLSLEATLRLGVRWAETRSLAADGSLALSRQTTISTQLSNDALTAITSTLSLKYYF